MWDRCILHCDLNSFYASVECLEHPELKGLPVAVCGRVEDRHGIVLAKNQEAKRCGIQTAEVIWKARQKCANLVLIEANMKKYMEYSRRARAIYDSVTDQIEPFGIDEAWLDVTGSQKLLGSGEEIAETLRRRMKAETGLTISVGVSFNKVYAKLGSDMKKPDAVTVISRENYRQRVWPLPVQELLFVGPATLRRLSVMGIRTIGELACTDPRYLQHHFGKNGLLLRQFAAGEDTSPVAPGDFTPAPKSIGNSMTGPHDLENDGDVRRMLWVLAESVAARLREAGYMACSVGVSARDTSLVTHSFQKKLDAPTDLCRELFDEAAALYFSQREKAVSLRSMGLCAFSLVREGVPLQLDLENRALRRMKLSSIERRVDQLRERFGTSSVQRAVLLHDPLAEGGPQYRADCEHDVSRKGRPAGPFQARF